MKTMTLMKEMEIGRINTVKVTILPKEIYRFNATPFKLPMAFFTRTKKLCGNTKYPQIKAVLRKTVMEESDSLSSDCITKLQ